MKGFGAFLRRLWLDPSAPADPAPPAPMVLAPPVLWCAECGDEVGDDVCYSVGGNVVFCGSRCRAVWEDVFNEF